MKKIFWCILIVLIVVAGMNCKAEQFQKWAYDPRVEIYVVNRVDEEARYSVYYCIGDTYFITLERDLNLDTGRITMFRDDCKEIELCYETDWGNKNQAEKTIDQLVSQALEKLD